MNSPESIAFEALRIAHSTNGDRPSAKEAAESAFGKGFTSSRVRAILEFIHFTQGDFAATEQMLPTSLSRDPAAPLTRFCFFELYLATSRCEKSEPPLNWLVERETNEEPKDALASVLEECYIRRF